MSRFVDLTGRVYGRLTIVEVASRAPVTWRCRCSCGGEQLAQSGQLNWGRVQSCGCLRVEVARDTLKRNRKQGKGLAQTGDRAIEGTVAPHPTEPGWWVASLEQGRYSATGAGAERALAFALRQMADALLKSNPRD